MINVEKIAYDLELRGRNKGKYRITTNGKEMESCCPFVHVSATGKEYMEETPSFYISTESGAWICHACGRKGVDVKSLYKALGKLHLYDEEAIYGSGEVRNYYIQQFEERKRFYMKKELYELEEKYKGIFVIPTVSDELKQYFFNALLALEDDHPNRGKLIYKYFKHRGMIDNKWGLNFNLYFSKLGITVIKNPKEDFLLIYVVGLGSKQLERMINDKYFGRMVALKREESNLLDEYDFLCEGKGIGFYEYEKDFYRTTNYGSAVNKRKGLVLKLLEENLSKQKRLIDIYGAGLHDLCIIARRFKYYRDEKGFDVFETDLDNKYYRWFYSKDNFKNEIISDNFTGGRDIHNKTFLEHSRKRYKKVLEHINNNSLIDEESPNFYIVNGKILFGKEYNKENYDEFLDLESTCFAVEEIENKKEKYGEFNIDTFQKIKKERLEHLINSLDNNEEGLIHSIEGKNSENRNTILKLKESDTLYIVESTTDFFKLSFLGFYCITTHGANVNLYDLENYLKTNAKSLSQFGRVVLLPHNDRAGFEWSKNIKNVLIKSGIFFNVLKRKDISEFNRKGWEVKKEWEKYNAYILKIPYRYKDISEMDNEDVIFHLLENEKNFIYVEGLYAERYKISESLYNTIKKYRARIKQEVAMFEKFDKNYEEMKKELLQLKNLVERMLENSKDYFQEHNGYKAKIPLETDSTTELVKVSNSISEQEGFQELRYDDPKTIHTEDLSVYNHIPEPPPKIKKIYSKEEAKKIFPDYEYIEEDIDLDDLNENNINNNASNNEIDSNNIENDSINLDNNDIFLENEQEIEETSFSEKDLERIKEKIKNLSIEEIKNILPDEITKMNRVELRRFLESFSVMVETDYEVLFYLKLYLLKTGEYLSFEKYFERLGFNEDLENKVLDDLAMVELLGGEKKTFLGWEELSKPMFSKEELEKLKAENLDISFDNGDDLVK